MYKKQLDPYSYVPIKLPALKQLCMLFIPFSKVKKGRPFLLINASNAFNSLNRETALHNIQRLCPSLATALINT